MTRDLPPVPNLRRLEIAITVEIYTILSQQSSRFVKPDTLFSSFSASSGLWGQFAYRASKNGYYRIDSDGDFLITAKGLDLIIEENGIAGSDVRQYIEEGANWIFRSDASLEQNTPFEDAANDIWEPLPIDRESSAYQEMVSAAESALHQIESNNGYATSNPEERDGIVLAIRGTLNTIKSGNPTLGYIKSGLLLPLQFIASKFAEASMGEFAKMAAKAVLTWLGFHSS